MTIDNPFTGLEPQGLWDHFSALCRIPRPSGREAEAANYISSWAKVQGYEVRRDGVGNLAVWVPGVDGNTRATPTVLQGHLDIVCERDSDSPYDAEAGRIHVVRDGDWLRAEGTTLGADNGIGVAAMLHAAESAVLNRGPLDLLFTVDEEVGFTGAAGLDPSLLRGRVLLNLDTEDDGVLCVGCAGGGDTRMVWAAELESVAQGWTGLKIVVGGLQGGHSGTDIHKNRLNAIRAIARLLKEGSQGTPLVLGSIDGGNKRNAIPRECQATVFLPTALASTFCEGIERAEARLAGQFRGIEDGLRVMVQPTVGGATSTAFRVDATHRFLDFLLAAPTGVLGMSQEIPGLVETSTNLAVVRSSEGSVEVVSSSRSSSGAALRDVLNSLAALARLAGATWEEQNQYPGWQPDLDSRSLAVARQAYHRLYGQEPIVTAVHAGLECGLIGERVPGMDMVSFGPQITGPHAPGERVHIPSVGRFWSLLTEVLKDLASPETSITASKL